jgi:hypothetical protein
MLLQQVTLSIILLSSLVHSTAAAMNNPEENPKKTRTLSWKRTASGTMYYSYPDPNSTNNHAYLESPAAFETTFRQILSLNMDSHRSRGKSNDFLSNYEAKQLQSLNEHKQVIIARQQQINPLL